jgi:hypothetical protein
MVKLADNGLVRTWNDTVVVYFLTSRATYCWLVTKVSPHYGVLRTYSSNRNAEQKPMHYLVTKQMTMLNGMRWSRNASSKPVVLNLRFKTLFRCVGSATWKRRMITIMFCSFPTLKRVGERSITAPIFSPVMVSEESINSENIPEEQHRKS